MKLVIIIFILSSSICLSAHSAQDLSQLLDNLYFYRGRVEKIASKLSELTNEKVLEEIKNVGHANLNYLGLHLLVKKDKRAIPVFIEFMNPNFKNENKNDPNYIFTWTLLEILIGDRFIISSSNENIWYDEYKKWWDENGENYKLTLDDQKISLIFSTIKENEDRKYRSNW